MLEISDVASMARIGAMASLSSRATTSIHEVPAIGTTLSNRLRDAMSACSKLLSLDAASSLSITRSLDKSAMGLRVSAWSRWAMILPSADTRNPKLCGVGWMEATLATTDSM